MKQMAGLIARIGCVLSAAFVTMFGCALLAAELYKTMANDKSPVENLYRLLAHPEMEFTTIPNHIMKYVDFMHQTGQIKVRAASWKELFFPEVHNLPGS